MSGSEVASRFRERGISPLHVIAAVLALLVLFVMASMGIAVNSARETARRTYCINNQRNLALAMQQYNAHHSRLPGWVEPMVPWEEDAAPVPMGWVFPTLPFLERGDLFHKGTAVGAPTYNKNPRDWPVTGSMDGGDPHLRVLVCPNDSTAVNSGMNLSYVVNAGFRDRDAENIGPFGGGEPSYDGPEQDGPASAVFLNRYRTAAAKAVPTQSLERISEGDGTSSTLMFSENLHAGRWDLGSDLDPAGKPREGFVTFHCANTLDGGSSNQLRINAAVGVAPRAGEGMLPGADSYHPGGVVAAFCDGHTVFIRQDVDWKTWCLLFTPHGESLETTWPDGQGKPCVFHKMVLNERF